MMDQKQQRAILLNYNEKQVYDIYKSETETLRVQNARKSKHLHSLQRRVVQERLLKIIDFTPTQKSQKSKIWPGV